MTKGIILAGGAGSRLYPVTQVACKQLLPIYDKPLIYYPLSTLMLFGIREVLVISTRRDLPLLQAVLGDGAKLGIRLSYAIQEEPKGIAQALIIAREFLNGEPCALILGDNIFYGDYDFLRGARAHTSGATVFAYVVRNPERYGVVKLDAQGKPISIIEKPTAPMSHWAVTGLYLYDAQAVEIAANLKPSGRGELEITDVNRAYLERGQLHVVQLGRGIAWLDTGTPDDMLNAAEFIATIERRQGLKIGCIEEVAYQMRCIDERGLSRIIETLPQSDYRVYLERVAADGRHSR
jgi:glucose-1-phosphate thymidylyltransferase